MVHAQNEQLQSLLRDAYDTPSLRRIRSVLDEHGSLSMRPLATGLFSAALVSDFSRGTNYHAVWTRDNVHVAYAHFANGRPEVAAATAQGLAGFYRTQRGRMGAIVREPGLKLEPMNRPHIRFDGSTCTELAQDWSHAQNDALGYFVWLYVTLARNGVIPLAELDVELLADFLAYFRAIEYWADEDSGHWEEAVKVEASSIGAVVAGLRQVRALCRTCASAGRLENGTVVSDGVGRRIAEAIPDAQVEELLTAFNTLRKRHARTMRRSCF
jgi:hypothetical protein